MMMRDVHRQHINAALALRRIIYKKQCQATNFTTLIPEVGLRSFGFPSLLRIWNTKTSDLPEKNGSRRKNVSRKS